MQVDITKKRDRIDKILSQRRFTLWPHTQRNFTPLKSSNYQSQRMPDCLETIAKDSGPDVGWQYSHPWPPARDIRLSDDLRLVKSETVGISDLCARARKVIVLTY